MKPYDDARYIEWLSEFGKLVAEFLTTEGNTVQSLKAELENAIANVDEAGEDE